MIIFLDGQGRLVNKQQEDINQGSNLANIIYLVAPIPNTTQVLAYFTLPNSTVTKPRYVIAETSSPDIIKLGNENYNVWSLKLDAPITAYYGQASVSFCFISGEEKLNSDLINFNISKGISVKLPEDLSQIKALDDILTLVSDVYGTNENLYNQVQDIDTQVEEIDNHVRALETIAGVLQSDKQDKLTAGDGITIDNKVIKVEVDSELSTDSTNPVQNKVVTEVIVDAISKAENALNGASNAVNTANHAYNMAGQNQWEIAEIHTKIDTLHANAFVPLEEGEELPKASEEHLGKIYLLPIEGSDNNYYDEYIVIKLTIPLTNTTTFEWERIGSTSIDLTNYLKTSDGATTAQIKEKVRTNKFLAPYYVDDIVKVGLTTNTKTLTAEEKTAACNLIGALENKLPDLRNYGDVRLLGINYGGQLTYTNVFGSASQYSVPLRDVNGCIKVATPTSNEHATPKEYVDNATKLYLHDVTISCYSGTVNFKMINKKSTSFVLGAHSFDLPIISDIIATPYDGERTIAYDFIVQGEDQGGAWVEMFYARREDGSAIVFGPTDVSFGIIDNIKTL